MKFFQPFSRHSLEGNHFKLVMADMISKFLLNVIEAPTSTRPAFVRLCVPSTVFFNEIWTVDSLDTSELLHYMQ